MEQLWGSGFSKPLNKSTNDLVVIVESYENEFAKSENTNISLFKLKKTLE